MTVLYQEYFGLKEAPFSIAPDPRYLFMSEQHRDALAHLAYGIGSDGGFILLTGDVGTGKTTISRCLLEQIPPDTHIAFVLNPRLSVEELLAVVCDELGIAYPEGNVSNKIFIDCINRFLLAEYEKGHKTVLIIEEAQNLSRDLLEQLRLLTNLETNRAKLLQIILIGQPELRDMLRQPDMSQLEQRVTARFHLGPLSKDDVGLYVNHRLSRAGIDRQLFPPGLMGLIYRISSGVPRLINLVCDRALLGTYVQGRDRVDRSTLKKAAAEVLGRPEQSLRIYAFLKWFGALLVLLIIIAASGRVPYRKIVTSINSPAAQAPEKADTSASAAMDWPAGRPSPNTEELAYKALFGLWGLDYTAGQKKTLCSQAVKTGLQCLRGSGDMKRVLSLNRPAVIKIFDSKGNIFPALLKSVQGGSATLLFDNKELSVSMSDIEKRWLGEYLILWKAPPFWHGDIRAGQRGKQIEWLAGIVSRRTGDSRFKGRNVYDQELNSEVRKFQLEEGLLPDGVVGIHTVIHFNSRYGDGEPLLGSRNGGGK